jgi:predicted SprT family Zn-dependent metalloprotease
MKEKRKRMNQTEIKKIKVNTYSDVYESCSECGRNMYKISQIWVSVESDRYLCKHCIDKYGIDAVRAGDLD